MALHDLTGACCNACLRLSAAIGMLDALSSAALSTSGCCRPGTVHACSHTERHDAALRPAPHAVADPAVASLALRLLCTATYVPRAARQLARESGLIPWLAGVAQAALEQLAQQGFDTNSSSAGGTQGTAESAEQALEAPLAALRRLLQLRAVMRGVGGAGVAQQMLAAARQLAGTAVAAACGAGGASDTAAPLVCHYVLPFLQEVQQQLRGGGSGPADSRRPPGGAQGLEDIAAAVQALTTVAEAAA